VSLSGSGGEYDSTGLRAAPKLGAPLLRCESLEKDACCLRAFRSDTVINKKGSRQAPLLVSVRRACPIAWRCKSSSQPDGGGDSEAQGPRREVRPERSVEQSREPMNKNWMRGRQCSGELANGSEAPIHQEHPLSNAYSASLGLPELAVRG